MLPRAALEPPAARTDSGAGAVGVPSRSCRSATPSATTPATVPTTPAIWLDRSRSATVTQTSSPTATAAPAPASTHHVVLPAPRHPVMEPFWPLSPYPVMELAPAGPGRQAAVTAGAPVGSGLRRTTRDIRAATAHSAPAEYQTTS